MARKKTGNHKIPYLKGSAPKKRSSTGAVDQTTVDFAVCCTAIQPVLRGKRGKKPKPKPMDTLDLTEIGNLGTCTARVVYQGLDIERGETLPDFYRCILRNGVPVGVIDPVSRKFKIYATEDTDDMLGQLQRGFRSKGYGDL